MTQDTGGISGSRASTEPSGLGPPGFDPGRKFAPGLVELRIVNPECRIMVDGHSDGVFGIDRRERIDLDTGLQRVVHTITHLRTGGVVLHVKGPLANAKTVAAILHTAPWDFDDPADCKNDGRKEAAEEAKATGFLVPHYEVRLPDGALAKIAKARGEQVTA